MRLSGWGRHPVIDTTLLRPADPAGTSRLVRVTPSLIACGNGRAYGDAAVNPAATMAMTGLDRFIAFDASSGSLTCEAGCLLADVLAHFVPRGFFPPVTPGTRFVTIGGMVAADVHGKNHHLDGSFGSHVEELTLATASGDIITCSPGRDAELFHATIGGMGLTGIILSVRFRLIRIETAWIEQEVVRAPDIDAAMRFFEESADWPYSVAWIDCLAGGTGLGRSIGFRGRHAPRGLAPERGDLRPPGIPRRRLPLDAPPQAVNRFTVGAFNQLYWARHRPGKALIDCERFFYPLDALLDWNRMYGPCGFIQYQCVVPAAAAPAALPALLERVAASGSASFLAVLKMLGAGCTDRPMSFPLNGYTLALDFPLAPALPALLADLDRIVAAAGGRLYLAKDAHMSPDMLRAGYPDLGRFQRLRSMLGADKFSSSLSTRLRL